jgi:long-chain acyl-CoA synthetase
VVFDAAETLPEGVLGWDAFLALGEKAMAGVPDETFRRDAAAIGPDEVVTILYTSGTTGDPKGVMLTHQNLYSNVIASSRILAVGTDDSTLSFLPLSHVFQRMVDYLLFSSGCMIAYARSLEQVAEDLVLVKPTIVVSVPRLYEKVYAKVMESGGVKGVLVRWAEGVGAQWTDVTLEGRKPGPFLAARHALADRIVFRKIRERVGGRLRFFVSGGAPLAPHINRFFYGAGITILEGYGLTETSPVTNVNSPEHFRIGTVGRPVPGTEIRIAEDGEILVRGPQVMKGYFKRPEATAEVLTEDGWFHTGDIGEIDRDGYLRITDRKKDIIVTAGGKNVAPQPIEGRLKSNRWVDQAVLVGDRRKFLSLLVVPDFAALAAWASEQGIESPDRATLLRHPKVKGLMEQEVLGELGDLARFEAPKKIVLIDREFTIEDGSLTPTQKVKRRVVEERYKDLIDSLYSDEAIEQTTFVA